MRCNPLRLETNRLLRIGNKGEGSNPSLKTPSQAPLPSPWNSPTGFRVNWQSCFFFALFLVLLLLKLTPSYVNSTEYSITGNIVILFNQQKRFTLQFIKMGLDSLVNASDEVVPYGGKSAFTQLEHNIVASYLITAGKFIICIFFISLSGII